MSAFLPYPYTDACVACSVILDDDEQAANPRVVKACEAVRSMWSNGDSVDEPVCVDCCAAGIPALHNGEPLDCEGDCQHLKCSDLPVGPKPDGSKLGSPTRPAFPTTGEAA